MLSFFATLSLSTVNITIAKKGEDPLYTIVISKEDPFKNQRIAAREFKNFVKNITGVDLPILTDDQPLPPHAIILGDTNYTKEVCKDIKDIDPEQDAFHWKVAGDHIVLNGGRRGLCYGVFEIFERFAGVRFYATFMFVVPKAETFEIPADLNLFSEADFYYRETYDPDILENYLWYLYQRYDSGENYVTNNLGNTKRGAGCHTIAKLMKRDEYPLSKYPERYAVIEEGGKERTDTQPCLSNEDVYQTVLGSILENLNNEKLKDRYFFEVSQNDGHDYCHCPECTAKFILYGNRTSGLWVNFLNRLCNDVAKINPKVYFRTLAYVNTVLPPKNIKVHPNIMIRLCQYTTDHSIPLEESTHHRSVEFMEALKGWSKLTNNIISWIYSYNYAASELIHPNWFVIGKDMKTLKKYNVKGTFYDAELSHITFHNPYDVVARQFTCFDKMKGYIHQKMSWYASLNEDDVMNDFLRGYYGPKAAPYIRQYLDDAYNEVKEYHKGPFRPLYCDRNENLEVYKPLRTTFLDHGYKLWQKAIEAARTDTSDKRFLFNTQTGSISHCMSIFKYHKEFEMPATWTTTEIRPTPSKVMKEISTNIPQYCPSRTVPDQRTHRLCYLGVEENDIYARAYFNFTTSTHTPNTIKCGSSTFGSKEGLFNGRGGILQKGDWNYLEYNNGGFDFNYMTSHMINSEQYNGYHLNQTERGNFTKEADGSYKLVTKGYTITKKYTAVGEGVKGSFTLQFTNEPTTKSINSIVSVACKLDNDGSSVAWQRGDKWEKFKLHPKQKVQFAGFKENARIFTIASPLTNRAMKFELNRDPECVSIELNRTSQTYRVFIHFRDTFKKDAAADVTITPLTDIAVPENAVEKENDYFDGVEMFQFMSYEDVPEGDKKFRQYVGGDEKATSGRALIVDYIGSESIGTHTSPKYNVVTIVGDYYINGIHKGDSYTFSTHIRCDITDANKTAFTTFYMDNYYGMPWRRESRKNVSEYTWFNLTLKNITQHQHFFIQPKSGASRCYIDKFRAIPLNLSTTFVPPRVPHFEIKNLEPMPALDMYKALPYNNVKEEESNNAKKGEEKSKGHSYTILAAVCVLAVVIIIAAVIGVVFIKCKKKADEDEENRSEITETILA